MIEFAMDYKEYFSINSLSIMNQEFSLKIFAISLSALINGERFKKI